MFILTFNEIFFIKFIIKRKKKELISKATLFARTHFETIRNCILDQHRLFIFFL